MHGLLTEQKSKNKMEHVPFALIFVSSVHQQLLATT